MNSLSPLVAPKLGRAHYRDARAITPEVGPTFVTFVSAAALEILYVTEALINLVAQYRMPCSLGTLHRVGTAPGVLNRCLIHDKTEL